MNTIRSNWLSRENATAPSRKDLRMPSENELMAQYGVARNTARQALDVLVAEGLLERVRGSGTYIRMLRRITRRGQTRLAVDRERMFLDSDAWDEDDDKARPVEATNFKSWVDTPPVTDRWLRRLMGDEERLVVRQRVHQIDGVPVQIATTRLPARLFHNLNDLLEYNTGPTGVWGRLAEEGHAVQEADEYVYARMPTADESKMLRLPAGTPVFEIRRVARDGRGNAVDVTDMVMNAALYRLHYRVRGSLEAPVFA
ncbi:GntR family transcriptional regulator [Microbispora bryophytorum]|uniref:GntR family transcriptional regulator n=1 Tax=Microbispora bryophytorum TaxID=1460882 RepID=UPI0033E16C0C